jgi:hypothetical protein
MSIRTSCINKAGGWHQDPHEAISLLGWINEQTRATGVASRGEVYEYVRRGGPAFTQDGLARAQLIAYLSRRGTKCVKTVPDSTKRDNLLNLGECA